jgi:sigma-E factor negative regulatory protein RseC
MVEESALVLKVESDIVWVQAIQQTACGSCQAQKGCGHSLLAKIGQKQIDIPVARNGIDVQPNERVIIGVPEQAILRSSMLMYGVPLLSMIVIALLGTSMGIPEGGIILMSFIALIVGFLWVNIKSKTLDFDQWNPQLVRKINSEQMHIPMCEVE